MKARTRDRLEQVVEHSIVDRLVDQVGMAVGGEDDHRSSRILDNLPGGGEAVEPRHFDVHQHDVGKCLPTHVDGLLPIVDDGHDVVSQRFELGLQARRH